MPTLRRLALAVVAGLAAGAIAPAAQAAWAADAVLATSPADGAALADAPRAVDPRPSAPADVAASHVTVWDAAGTDLDTGALTRLGDSGLRQPVSIRGPGDFTLT